MIYDVFDILDSAWQKHLGWNKGLGDGSEVNMNGITDLGTDLHPINQLWFSHD